VQRVTQFVTDSFVSLRTNVSTNAYSSGVNTAVFTLQHNRFQKIRLFCVYTYTQSCMCQNYRSLLQKSPMKETYTAEYWMNTECMYTHILFITVFIRGVDPVPQQIPKNQVSFAEYSLFYRAVFLMGTVALYRVCSTGLR